METLEDVINRDPELEVAQQDIAKKIEGLLMELQPRLREIIARRFGLLGYDKETLEETGNNINLTRERVRQLQLLGISELRDLIQSGKFK